MQRQRIEGLIETLLPGLQEKETVIRLALLATLAGEHVFLHGPTGTAKSLIARRLAGIFPEGRRFEYLLGRFTTPEELFGPISITRMKDHDRYERVTEGFLPDADIVFLDEIWNASSPILNTLLTVINERRFRNGREEMPLPLKSVISASRDVAPDDPALQNLWDRFLLRITVQPIVEDDAFLSMIHSPDHDTPRGRPSGGSGEPADRQVRVTIDELDEWHDAIETVTIPEDLAALILDVRERIRRHNTMQDGDTPPLVVSDRRWHRIARLLRASAWFNDRTTVDALDCILMRHCLWSRPEEIEVVDTIVRQAVQRYATSGRFDVTMYRDRLDTITAAIQDAGCEVLRESVTEPVEYRGEYYRVVDFVEDHETLIWIGDYQQLEREAVTETDLFFYDSGDDYAYSERFPMLRDDDDAIIIGDERYYLETREVERDRQRNVQISRELLETFRGQLESLREEVQAVTEEIQRFRDESSTAARNHLFVHRAYAEIVTQGMNQAGRDLRAMALEVESVMDSLTP